MNNGRLYLVATPIGNLGDLAPRAATVLGEVSIIAAEDTRHSGRLLKHIGVTTPMVSCHEHNEGRRLEELLGRMKAGEDVALISDAGTPGISDPGFVLARAVRREGIEIVVIPGPCAAIAALAGSGLPTDRFLFVGFPPKRPGRRRKWIEEMQTERGTLVLYESPFRLGKLCAELLEVFGDRPACLAREITKIHEEFIPGTLSVLAKQFEERRPKGELVLVIAGAEQR